MEYFQLNASFLLVKAIHESVFFSSCVYLVKGNIIDDDLGEPNKSGGSGMLKCLRGSLSHYV